MTAPVFPPRPGDLDVDVLLRELERLARGGMVVWVKWTCPRCGERCTADEPFSFHPEGYTHTTRRDGSPCGYLYVGPKWGIRALVPLG